MPKEASLYGATLSDNLPMRGDRMAMNRG
jgi:hypothetical protein